MNLSFLLLQLLLACLTAAKSYTKSKDAVLLSNVRSLTLTNGKKTTARRVSAIPQLTCVGGNAKGLYDIDVMRCKNSGSEYDPEDIQWTCQANLPPDFKLGSTDVVCEGFDSSDDPYVLKGSCGVEYRMILTSVGEEKYGSGSWFKSRVNDLSTSRGRSPSKSLGSMLFTVIFWAAFIGILGLILYSVFNPQNPGQQPRRPRNPLGGGGRFWGGGGGGDDDPPPPYTPRAPPRSKPSSSAPRSSRSSNSGPGFWSGAGMGAAGGYMAGQYMGNRTRQQEQARQQNMFGAGPSNYGQGGSSWFGGGGGGGSSSAGPSTSPSSSRYESSGFGGTRRR